MEKVNLKDMWPVFDPFISLVFYPHHIFLSPCLHRAQTLTELTGWRGNHNVITVLGAPGEARRAVERVGIKKGFMEELMSELGLQG